MPFTRAEAIAAGVTPKMLRHPRFTRLFPSVYCETGAVLSDRQMILAGKKALPDDAVVSHETCLRLAGLDDGPLLPLHFLIARDHHIDIPGITLHRTVAMPPNDGYRVTTAVAFVQVAASKKLADAVAIGDWLLYRDKLSLAALGELAETQSWRPGVTAAVAAVPLLDGRARSIPESQTRTILAAVGLPIPEVNGDIFADGEFIACGDLVFREWKLIVEYEGRQHAESRRQFRRDIDRYAALRVAGWEYIQVTAELLARPRVLASLVHQRLRERGYDGPPPHFGSEYQRLFLPAGWSLPS